MVTDVLDLIGLVALVLAVAVFVWPFSIAGAVAVVGVGLLFVSWLIDARARRSRKAAS
jgi:hypothetical protein